MIRLKTVGSFIVSNNELIMEVEYFNNFEAYKNKKVIIDCNTYTVIDVDRNRCSTFFYGTEEEWSKRNVFLKVKR